MAVPALNLLQCASEARSLLASRRREGAAGWLVRGPDFLPHRGVQALVAGQHLQVGPAWRRCLLFPEAARVAEGSGTGSLVHGLRCGLCGGAAPQLVTLWAIDHPLVRADAELVDL